MSFSPFEWIRRKAAEAVALGVADGVQAVAPDADAPPADLTELRAMLADRVPRALPAATGEEEPPTARRKK